MKNLLKMSDLTPGELTHILDVADQFKAQQKLGGTAPLLAGKTVAMLFSKASTRTRTSFEVGGVVHDVQYLRVAAALRDAGLQRLHDGAGGAVRLLAAAEYADIAGFQRQGRRI